MAGGDGSGGKEAGHGRSIEPNCWTDEPLVSDFHSYAFPNMWKENGGEPSVPENFLDKALSSSGGVSGCGKIFLPFLKASSADDCVFYGEPVCELQVPSYPHQANQVVVVFGSLSEGCVFKDEIIRPFNFERTELASPLNILVLSWRPAALKFEEASFACSGSCSIVSTLPSGRSDLASHMALYPSPQPTSSTFSELVARTSMLSSRPVTGSEG